MVYLKQAQAFLSQSADTQFSNYLSMSQKKELEAIELKPTHYYIAFKPKSAGDLSDLEKIKGIGLIDRPIHYEIFDKSPDYRTLNIPSKQPNYQYSIVKVNQDLPNHIEYEIIKELVIPLELTSQTVEESALFKETNRTLSAPELDVSLSNLVLVSCEMTGADKLAKHIKEHILSMSQEKQGKIGSLSKEKKETCVLGLCAAWQPSGSVKVLKDNTDLNSPQRPLIGIRVGFWSWLLPGWSEDDTDDAGYFRSPLYFFTTVNYEISFTNDKFIINYSPVDQLSASRVRDFSGFTSNSYNTVYGNTDMGYYATVYRATEYYANRETFGFSKLPTRSIFSLESKVVIWASNNPTPSSITTHAHGLRNVLGQGRLNTFFTDIATIGYDAFIAERVNDFGNVYSTTIHELAHVTHASNNPGNFYATWLFCNNYLGESYALAVQYFLTLPEYQSIAEVERHYNNSNAQIDLDLTGGIPSNFILNCNDKSNSIWYTNLVIDLIDNKNCQSARWSYPDNSIIGYRDSLSLTPEEVEASLFGLENYSLHTIVNQLINGGALQFQADLQWQAWANSLKTRFPYLATKIQRAFTFCDIKRATPQIPRAGSGVLESEYRISRLIIYPACNSSAILPRRNVPPPPSRYDPPPGGIELPDDEPIQ